ncbi:MAG: Ku protein [Alphaproteobacteria bacterium]
MAARAYWKGYLKLSLVSAPVKLFSATSPSANKVSFNFLHKDTHNRINMRPHDPELGEVDRADLVKGYQFEKDRYVVFTPEEIEAVQIESSKTIDIDGFVNESEIDPIYLDSPYYLGPDGPVADETYAVVMEAMRRAKKVAIARIVIAGRERLIAIAPKDNVLRLTTLRTNNEVRAASDYVEPIKAKVSADALEMAQQIIAKRPIKFEPDKFVDRYEEAVLDMVKAKIAGKEPVVSKAPERGQVINLMDALRRSIEEERRPAAASKSQRKESAAATKPAAAKSKGAQKKSGKG